MGILNLAIVEAIAKGNSSDINWPVSSAFVPQHPRFRNGQTIQEKR